MPGTGRPASVMIGHNLAHYEVLEELGRGGMGVVYKARDTRLDRLVALKLLPEKLAGDPRRVELLRREAQASAALNHPRIVTVHSVEEAEGKLFLTMEYVEGETLDRAIPEHGFDLERFFKIAIPLADALGAAHDRGIVHRDLKPGNILLSRDDRPKILDFGLARLRPHEQVDAVEAPVRPLDSQLPTQLATLEGKLAGTVPYMSPEQLGRGPVDHRTDIFSLGIVLYQMLTGHHPFRRGEGSVVSSILEEEPDSVVEVRSGLPRQLDRIIRRCLLKDPERRIQSAKDLRNELHELSLELGRPRRELSRRVPRLALPAVVLLTLLATAGVVLWSRRGEPPVTAGPVHLAFQEQRFFPGDRGPSHFRRGLISWLRQRSGRMSGVYLADGELHPLPDVVAQVDVRRTAESVGFSYRLEGSLERTGLGEGIVEGGPEEALELADRAIREIAGLLETGLGRDIRFRAGDPPTAVAAAYDLYLEAAAAWEKKGPGAEEEALELLARARLRDPALALTPVLEGRILLTRHDADPATELVLRAESACRTATELDPELAAASTCLGDSLLAKGRALEAVAAYRNAIRLDPTDLASHTGLRRAYLDLGLPDSLEETWKELIRVHPTYWGVHYSLAGHYVDRDRYDLALARYGEALRLAPRHPHLHALLGSVYYVLGRYDEALRSCRSSIDLHPNWAAAYTLGAVYFTLRRFTEAINAFEQAVELRPEHYATQGRLGWACYWAPGRREEAVGHLERAVTLAHEELEAAPRDGDVYIMLAVFEALRGRRAESLEALEKAFYYQPDYAHYHFLGAVAHTHLGDAEAAIDLLEQAVAKGYPTAEIHTFTDLDPLREEPRFQALLRKDSTI